MPVLVLVAAARPVHVLCSVLIMAVAALRRVLPLLRKNENQRLEFFISVWCT